jgi:hypothetical protein
MVSFRFLREADHWVAHASIDERSIELQAHRFPPSDMHLVSITNLEPYIERDRILRAPASSGGTSDDPGAT